MWKLMDAPPLPWEGKNWVYFTNDSFGGTGVPRRAKDNCPPELLKEYQIYRDIAEATVEVYGEDALYIGGLF